MVTIPYLNISVAPARQAGASAQVAATNDGVPRWPDRVGSLPGPFPGRELPKVEYSVSSQLPHRRGWSRLSNNWCAERQGPRWANIDTGNGVRSDSGLGNKCLQSQVDSRKRVDHFSFDSCPRISPYMCQGKFANATGSAVAATVGIKPESSVSQPAGYSRGNCQHYIQLPRSRSNEHVVSIRIFMLCLG